MAIYFSQYFMPNPLLFHTLIASHFWFSFPSFLFLSTLLPSLIPFFLFSLSLFPYHTVIYKYSSLSLRLFYIVLQFRFFFLLLSISFLSSSSVSLGFLLVIPPLCTFLVDTSRALLLSLYFSSLSLFFYYYSCHLFLFSVILYSIFLFVFCISPIWILYFLCLTSVFLLDFLISLMLYLLSSYCPSWTPFTFHLPPFNFPLIFYYAFPVPFSYFSSEDSFSSSVFFTAFGVLYSYIPPSSSLAITFMFHSKSLVILCSLWLFSVQLVFYCFCLSWEYLELVTMCTFHHLSSSASNHLLMLASLFSLLFPASLLVFYI